MKLCIGIVMAIFLFGAVSLTALSTAETAAQSDDESASLVMTTCTKCHNAKRICKNLGEKNQEEWDKTVTRMIKKGAQLPIEKKGLVIEYFLSQTPGSKPLCE
jgi:cytochrome c5